MALNLKRPIPCIVEYENADGMSELQSESIAHLFRVNAAQEKQGHPTFSLICFDPRETISSTLDGLHCGIGDALTAESPPSHIVKHYLKDEFQDILEPYNEKDWQTVEKEINAGRWVNPGLSTKDYEAYLRKNLQQLIGLLQKYADKPKVTALL